MHFLKSFDCFGSPMPIQITQNQSVYKSVIGGIISIFLGIASLTYTIWMLIQWQSNQLNPKISTNTFQSDFKLLDLSQSLIHIYFWKQKEEQIDPLKEKILLPFINYNQVDSNQNNFHYLQAQYNDNYNGVYVVNPQINFDSEQAGNRKSQHVSTELALMLCEEAYLPPGEHCASQELIDKFFQQKFNTMCIDVSQKTLNPLTKQEEITFQEYFIQIELEFCQGLTIFLSTTRYQIKDAFIYGPAQFKEFVSQITAFSQTNSQNYCANYYNFQKVVGYFYITLDTNQKLTFYEYPNLGDILANIGSIVSVLFSAKYLIQYLNQIYLHTQLIDLFISFYYPQFKDIKVKRNWFNQIRQAKLDDVEFEINQFKKFYKDVNSKIRCKMSFSNLFYEISRLYFLIRSFKSKQEISKCHMLGIKLTEIPKIMKDFDAKSGEMSSNTSNRKFQAKQNNLLEFQDLDLISLNERLKISEELVDDELVVQDFYQINKCL